MPHPAEQFEDEPLTGSGRRQKRQPKPKSKRGSKKNQKMAPAHSAGSAAFVLEGVDEAMTKEEERRIRRQKRRDARAARTGRIVVSICCCLLVIALICIAALWQEIKLAVKGDPIPSHPPLPTHTPVTPKPTPAPATPTEHPTLRPTQRGTPAPTRSPAPAFTLQDSYTLKPNQDTYIYRSGKEQNKSFGLEKTLLVQKGTIVSPNMPAGVPEAVALLTFDISQLPRPSRWNQQTGKARLRLFHVPLSLADQAERPNPHLVVSRLLDDTTTDHQLKNVEYLDGSFLPFPATNGPSSVLVEATATVVEFDISSLLMNNDDDDMDYDTQLLFLVVHVDDQDPEQIVGDRFYSRDSVQPPELLLTNLLPS